MAGLVRRAGIGALLAASVLSGCSSSSHPSSSPTTPASVAISPATDTALARSVCGGLRAVRKVADRLHALTPELTGDSASRSQLKQQLLTDFGVANQSAVLGADFVAKAESNGRPEVVAYRDGVVAALHGAAADYARWEKQVRSFPIFDRDNWEIALLSTENGVIRTGGWPAWERIAGAVGARPVGPGVAAAAAPLVVCRGVVE
jgi:hypothetical protein